MRKFLHNPDVLGGDAGSPSGWTLTRLHYRYGADGLKEDLVFRAAPPVIGGRGVPDASGELAEHDAAPSSYNQFQGRYVILHRWEGSLACQSPHRGTWGGPWDGRQETFTAGSGLNGPVARTSRPLSELLLDGFGAVHPRQPSTRPTPPPGQGIPEMQE